MRSKVRPIVLFLTVFLPTVPYENILAGQSPVTQKRTTDIDTRFRCSFISSRTVNLPSS